MTRKAPTGAFRYTSSSSAGGRPSHQSANERRSVVVTAFAMDVAVGDFLGVGLAHVDYLDLEVQALAGQRMVAVDGHVVAVDVADGDDLHAAVRSRGVELHADFQFVDAFEHLAGRVATSSALYSP